ncbi:hypothetical protein EG329_004947 [Mollisiaceae sp. DMI_Dod_QoI]|nr:hypothetical protein EG329_004947 [Helotiales sp. DMI_Dod_QoI]
MSGLANALRRIAKSASHPNALLYKTQLERAKQKYLVQGQLGDGKEDAFMLGSPEEEIQKQERGQKTLKTKEGIRSNGLEEEAETQSGRGLEHDDDKEDITEAGNIDKSGRESREDSPNVKMK